jgi:predicted DsbA family dithiol-disulfide isomerase
VDGADATITIWSDIGCPWAHRAVHRLHDARARLGLDGRVRFVHRPFPLELFNEQPTPKDILDVEVAALSAHDPDAGWQPWSAPEWSSPVTMLPALEAVQAAAALHAVAGEQLDRELRRAFFAESRCISLHHVILDVAARCDAVDTDRLAAALENGSARHRVMDAFREAEASDVLKGSPHVFLADGSDVHNPGIRMHWEEKDTPRRRVVIDGDEPAVYDALLRRAAAVAA